MRGFIDIGEMLVGASPSKIRLFKVSSKKKKKTGQKRKIIQEKRDEITKYTLEFRFWSRIYRARPDRYFLVDTSTEMINKLGRRLP